MSGTHAMHPHAVACTQVVQVWGATLLVTLAAALLRITRARSRSTPVGSHAPRGSWAWSGSSGSGGRKGGAGAGRSCALRVLRSVVRVVLGKPAKLVGTSSQPLLTLVHAKGISLLICIATMLRRGAAETSTVTISQTYWSVVTQHTPHPSRPIHGKCHGRDSMG